MNQIEERGGKGGDSAEIRAVACRVIAAFSVRELLAAGAALGLLDVGAALKGLTLGNQQVWERGQASHFYTDEATAGVEEAIFPRGAMCRYWRMTAAAANTIFPSGIVANIALVGSLQVTLPKFGIELFLSEFGFGMLSISVAAGVVAGVRDEDGGHRAAARCHVGASASVRRLVYALSQVNAGERSIWLRRPHQLDDPEKRKQIERAKKLDEVAPPPPADAPLVDRLTKAGGRWHLAEFARWLLPFDVRPFQIKLDGVAAEEDKREAEHAAGAVTVTMASRAAPAADHIRKLGGLAFPAFTAGLFNVYTVVRLRECAETLDTHPHRAALGELLVGLAQLHEPDHPGDLAEATGRGGGGHVANRALNRRIWSAVTGLGAAHIVLDQPGEGTNPGDDGFNAERALRLMSRYFIGWMLAHHQRRHGEMVAAEMRACVAKMGVGAGANAESEEAPLTHEAKQEHENKQQIALQHEAKARRLSRELADFEASAAFPSVSLRHAVNIWYRLCQRGEGATTALKRARMSAARLDLLLSRAVQEKMTEATTHNVEVVAHVQKNVEWLEIFIIAVYAIEFVHNVGHEWHFGEAYMQWSMILAPMLVGAGAFMLLEPHKLGSHTNHSRKSKWGRQGILLLLLAAAGIAWWWAGKTFTIPHDPNANTVQHELPSENAPHH